MSDRKPRDRVVRPQRPPYREKIGPEGHEESIT